jgi:hypothetical protein
VSLGLVVTGAVVAVPLLVASSGGNAVRTQCDAMSDRDAHWQLASTQPPQDTTSVRAAAARVQRDADRISDPAVRAAGGRFAATLRDIARAYEGTGSPDPALRAYHRAWTDLRVTCGLPTRFPDD